MKLYVRSWKLKSMFSASVDYIVGILTAWPGALLGLLLLLALIEGSLGRRLLFSTRVKLVLAAVIFLIGVATVHPAISRPGDAAIQRADEYRARRAREGSDGGPSDRDQSSDRRLKQEVDSLKQELAAERGRQR